MSDDRDESDATETPVTPLSTVDRGKPPEPVDSGTSNTSDAVRTALADAQQMARGRPTRSRRTRGPSAANTRADNMRGRQRGGYSGATPDETDPQPVGGVLDGYVADRGWQRPLAEARVFADWAGLVGADIAAHSAPSSLRDAELKVTAESTAWATQLRLMTAGLLARLAEELGPEVVSRLVVTGPVGPSWKHGGFSVRGTRGPRDTYG